MPKAVARTEKKYWVPRNRLIPEQSVSDILISGSLFKSANGKAEGYAMPLFRADVAPGVPLPMHKPGILFYFRIGRIYVFDEERTAASLLFEGAAAAAKYALPGIADLTGGTAKLVEKTGHAVLEKVGEAAREPKHHSQATLDDQVRMLESRGMVVLPGANVVDVEYQVEPAGFLSKEVHRLTYSYESSDGQQSRYQIGAATKGTKGSLMSGAIDMILTERMWAELGYLNQMIKAEFGRDDAEAERNGFTSVTFGRRALELLEPMREVYDRTPILAGMMQDLRAFAAGPPL